MWDVTNYKSYGLGLIHVNGVCKHIPYILDNILIFILPVFIKYTEACSSLMYPPNYKALSEMF